MSWAERVRRPGGVEAIVCHRGNAPKVKICDVCDGKPVIPTPWQATPGGKTRQVDLCNPCITRRESDAAFVVWSDRQIRRSLGIPGPVSADPAANTVGQSHGLAAQPTEVAAALAVAPRTGTQRAKVLRAVCRSLHGLTDGEIAAETGLYLYSAAPRRTELLQGGWVEDSGRRRETGNGGNAIAWQATIKGLSYATREGWLA